MDWNAVAAVAAVIAAVGAVVALLATTLQLHQERLAREVDYHLKLTPFLSFNVTELATPQTNPGERGEPAIEVYADGGGTAFMVLAKIIQTDSSTGKNIAVPSLEVIRYLREGPPGRIPFARARGWVLRSARGHVRRQLWHLPHRNAGGARLSSVLWSRPTRSSGPVEPTVEST